MNTDWMFRTLSRSESPGLFAQMAGTVADSIRSNVDRFMANDLWQSLKNRTEYLILHQDYIFNSYTISSQQLEKTSDAFILLTFFSNHTSNISHPRVHGLGIKANIIIFEMDIYKYYRTICS